MKKKRMIKLAKAIFNNRTYYGRKRVAKQLIEISPEYVSKYVEKGILAKWNQLTKGYTSNSAEKMESKNLKNNAG